MFSVIIPTKNEERHIAKLLKSIEEQTLQPDEIIVADKSTDMTREIAESYNATIVEGVDNGRVGIARNRGAEVSNSDFFIFIDADSELRSNTFFSKFVGKFIEKDLDAATCYYTPDRKNLKSILVFTGWNALKKWGDMTKKIISEGAGCFIIKKEVFNDLDGFDENMRVGEDADLIKRLIRNNYRFGVIPLLIKTSARRYSNTSGWNIVKIVAGAAGVGLASALGYKWLQKKLPKFEEMYGELGGEKDKPE
jgi:glycosyltransferase involved in cell wall biosynthesis